MATHPRAAVESLDPADAPAVDVIDWYVVKPERFSGWEIVQSNINAGVRCPLVDIVRLKSTFFDTMVDECEKRREKRILIPNGTFATPAELHAAVGWQFPSQIIIFPEGSIKSIILAYHKLDILKNIHGRAFLEEMGNKKEAMTPPERMNTGHVCHLPRRVSRLSRCWRTWRRSCRSRRQRSRFATISGRAAVPSTRPLRRNGWLI
jgi:uncharacterized protein YifE (UPF0438 family)